MIFPIGDENVNNGKPAVFSYLILIVNVFIFLYLSSQFSIKEIGEIFDAFGAKPCEILIGKDTLTAFSSMFLHSGIFHLIGNMLFLWIFANNIEATIGSFKFLVFYLLAGLISVVIFSITNGDSCISLVGASGAIAGVMGTYLVMFPKSKIKMFVFFFRFKIPAIAFLLYWIGREAFSYFEKLSLVNATGDNVAHSAHISGFVFGVLMGFIFKKQRNFKTRF